MRRNAMTKLLYWTTGFVTGCLLVLKYTRICDETDLVTVTPSKINIIKQIHLPEVVHIVANDVKSSTVNSTSAETSRQNNSTFQRSTEWLSCGEIEQIYFEVKSKANSQYRKENKDGNKDVFFTTIKNQTGHMIRVVVKHASLYNLSSESEVYRYRSAQREIDSLRKLGYRNWTGIPQLYGACTKKHDITYVVSEILGKPLCTGNGTDMECALGRHMRKLFHRQPDSEYSIILWLSKVTCFFKQFEEHQVFMEDFSGINFYFHPETLDFFVVDADSMIFYNGVRINSRSSCRDNHDCSRPTGNLWRYSALNHKIYYACQDGDGYCFNNNCWGYDSTLHTCGVAQWLLKPFLNFVPITASADYRSLITCMMEPSPEKRCSMINCCEKAKAILLRYRTFKNMQ